MALPDCAGLFAGSQTQFSALEISDGRGLLNLYLQQGWMSYGTTFLPNGGGAPVSFASLGPSAQTNTGGVTTYANASYTNASGTTVSANRIALNMDSFVFTGLVWQEQTQRAVSVGTAQPSAFGGMTQGQITGAAIIHELLHAVGAIASDANDPGKSKSNSERVKQNCFR